MYMISEQETKHIFIYSKSKISQNPKFHTINLALLFAYKILQNIFYIVLIINNNYAIFTMILHNCAKFGSVNFFFFK